MPPVVSLDVGKVGVLVIDGKRYIPQRFDVGGRVLELYSVQVLARALHRSSGTIAEWESFGLIPTPRYCIAGKGEIVEQRRFYSREQIINLYQVGKRFPFGPGKLARYRDHFFTAFNQVFELDEVINVGEISIQPSIRFPPVSSFTYEKTGQPEPEQLARKRYKNRRAVDNEVHHGNRGNMGSPSGPHQATGARGQQSPHLRQYPTSAHPNPDCQKPAYRRRPAQAVS